jgi:hypothetical protein
MKEGETNKYVRSMLVWLVSGGSEEREGRCGLLAKKAARLLDRYFQSLGSGFRDMY